MKVLFLKSATFPMVITLADVVDKQITILDTIDEDEILGGKPSETFFYGIDKLLKRNDLPYEALNALYIASGPGSYTGTRLAITIAKTLVFLIPDIAIYSASLLDVYKEMSNRVSGNADGHFLSLVYARKNKFYVSGILGKDVEIVDTIFSNEEVEGLFEQDLYCNGQFFVANSLDFSLVPTPLDYAAWYGVSTIIEDIHGFEPYYLEDVNIG